MHLPRPGAAHLLAHNVHHGVARQLLIQRRVEGVTHRHLWGAGAGRGVSEGLPRERTPLAAMQRCSASGCARRRRLPAVFAPGLGQDGCKAAGKLIRGPKGCLGVGLGPRASCDLRSSQQPAVGWTPRAVSSHLAGRGCCVAPAGCMQGAPAGLDLRGARVEPARGQVGPPDSPPAGAARSGSDRSRPTTHQQAWQPPRERRQHGCRTRVW